MIPSLAIAVALAATPTPAMIPFIVHTPLKKEQTMSVPPIWTASVHEILRKGPEGYYSGTAFAVKNLEGDIVFVTAAHVCGSYDEELWIGYSKTVIPYAIDFNEDVCVVMLKRESKEEFVTLPIALELPLPGEPLSTVGFPADMPGKHYFTGKLLDYVPDAFGYGRAVIHIDHGQSGGPVVNQYGEVVGVVVRMQFDRKPPIMHFVSLPYLRRILGIIGD